MLLKNEPSLLNNRVWNQFIRLIELFGKASLKQWYFNDHVHLEFPKMFDKAVEVLALDCRKLSEHGGGGENYLKKKF